MDSNPVTYEMNYHPDLVQRFSQQHASRSLLVCNSTCDLCGITLVYHLLFKKTWLVICVCINFDITICSTFLWSKSQNNNKNYNLSITTDLILAVVNLSLSSLLWHCGFGPMPTQTPFPLIPIKENEQKYGFSREQTYKSYTNIAAAVGNSTMFTVSLPNIMSIYVNMWYMLIPSSFFPKWHGIARALWVRLFLGEMHMGLRGLLDLDLGSWVRGPLPRMPVTTRIMLFLIGKIPIHLYFPLLLGGGHTQKRQWLSDCKTCFSEALWFHTWVEKDIT